MKADLAEAQRLLSALIVAPEGVDEALRGGVASRERLEEFFVGDDRISAADRVNIYANMYFYRLLDVMKEEYPATLAALGDSEFHNLVTDYLLGHPPSRPSVFFAGQHLPSFVQTHRLAGSHPYLGDVARVERTMIEVFHERDNEIVKPESLAGIEPSRWHAIELRLIAAHSLVECGWSAAGAIRAVQDGRAWSPPESGATTTLVWRKRNQVFHRELDHDEAECLKVVAGGITFGDLCERIADSAPSDDVVKQAFETLQRWLRDELLAGPMRGLETRERSAE